jgi:hypothetical protein
MPERKRPLARPRSKWMDNTCNEIEYKTERVICIHLVLVRVQCFGQWNASSVSMKDVEMLTLSSL